MRKTLIVLPATMLFTVAPVIAQGVMPFVPPAPPVSLDPFCAESAFAVAWDATKNEPTPGSTADTLVLWIRSQQPGLLDAHVTIVGDGGAYDAKLQDVLLTGNPTAPTSPPLMVMMPRSANARYVYVDSYSLNGAKEVSCPSEPHDVKAVDADEVHPPYAFMTRFTASFTQALPPLPCGKLSTEASVTHVVQPRGVSTTKTITTEIAVFVDSAGHAVKTFLYKSSGNTIADAQANASAALTQYAPATFLCTPIVGEYLFRADFAP
jgi:hypothetical protein